MEILYTLEELNQIHQLAAERKMMKEAVIAYLEGAKRHFSNLYYTGKSPLTDREYDELVIDFLQSLDPNNKVLKEVGAVGPQEKVKLPCPCGSLLNMKPEQIDKWMSFILKPREVEVDKFIGSQKLDGISCLTIYRYGVLVEAYKRGDGIIGHSILEHVRLMPSVPKTLKGAQALLPAFAVRGEAVMPEAVLTVDTDGHLGVAYGNLVGLLVEAIKELTARVEELDLRTASEAV